MFFTSEFGEVYQGTWLYRTEHGCRKIPVAIKTLIKTTESQKAEFEREADTMSRLDHMYGFLVALLLILSSLCPFCLHRHVVKMYGVCVHRKETMLVVEMVASDALNKYMPFPLLLHRLETHLCTCPFNPCTLSTQLGISKSTPRQQSSSKRQ